MRKTITEQMLVLQEILTPPKLRKPNINFPDFQEIHSLDDFLNSFPLFFIPQKEEIARFLALARDIHNERINRKEKEISDPIRILDVGGGNGALGKLITDLAVENGLNVEYIVVDPNTPLEQANTHYQSNPQMVFKKQTISDFNFEQYRDDSEILRLLTERADLIPESERKLHDLKKLLEEIKSQGTKRKTAKFDLVINSWMPSEVDLTNEIKEANGAAILYALEWYGATGCQPNAMHPSPPAYFGFGESYNPGTSYESRLGWISHATRQIIEMRRCNQLDFWRVLDDETYPYSNGFVLQTKKGYGQQQSWPFISTDGIRCHGRYPWGEELIKRGGQLSPTIELRDEDGKLNFDEYFSHLSTQLERKEA